MSHLLLYFANNNTTPNNLFKNIFHYIAVVRSNHFSSVFLLQNVAGWRHTVLHSSWRKRLRKIIAFFLSFFLRSKRKVHIVISMAWRIGNVYMNDGCERRTKGGKTKKTTKGNYVDSFYNFSFTPKKRRREKYKNEANFGEAKAISTTEKDPLSVCPVDCESNLCTRHFIIEISIRFISMM